MGIINAERDELSKILLVACDQSYDPAAKEGQTGNSLYGFTIIGNNRGQTIGDRPRLFHDKMRKMTQIIEKKSASICHAAHV